MENTAPASLTFLVDLIKNRSQLSPSVRRGLALLYHQIAVTTAAGFLLNNDSQGAFHIQELSRSRAMVFTFIKVLVLRFMPLNFLKLIRRIRHRVVDAP